MLNATTTLSVPAKADEASTRRSDGRRSRTALYILWAVVVGVAAVMLFADIPSLASGVLTIVLLLLLMAAMVPVGFAMVAAAGLGLISLGGIRVAEQSVEAVVFDSVASWNLMVVPMFILMGVAMWKGGITTLAYSAAQKWLGWLPGGLAVSTNFAGAGLASASGSTLGISMALGRMAIPEMYRAGYSPQLTTGTVAMAGTLGQIIPPSVLLVLYAGLVQVPVGAQLVAGIIPGIILAVAFALCIVVWALVKPDHAPRAKLAVSWDDRFRSLVGLVPLLIIGLCVVGGMLVGFFTATEAAAVGAVVAIVLSLATMKGPRDLRSMGRVIGQTVTETVVSVSGLFLLIIGAMLLSRAISLSGLAREISGWLIGLDLSRVQLLLALILVYVVLGMFLESFPMMVLTLPFLQGPLEYLGVDMIWFGIFIVIMCEIGMVFPPVGMVTFVVHRLAQSPEVSGGRKTSLAQVFVGVMPFVAVAVVIAVLFIFFPQIVLWLPETAAVQ
ncbi:TRAP transporter large permease [Rhodococcus sp. 14C212]|uniref:TRAP transporter large permease n=1 Tax=Rhodococcus sp. 14C212 TaxID=2711209 RepID=UPI0013EB09A4|nr:TRAP transporter large permease [Rhodococcus sp. 14C212]NGP07386.1 TRAP transporter large permease [Rhodococcus sp. 14C212]